MFGAFSYFLDGMSGGDAAQAAGLVTSSHDARTRGDLFNSNSATMPTTMTGRKNRNRKSLLEILLSPAIPLIHALTPCNRGRCLTNENSSSGIIGCAVLESALGHFKTSMPPLPQ
jgi:hypothetical protein